LLRGGCHICWAAQVIENTLLLLLLWTGYNRSIWAARGATEVKLAALILSVFGALTGLLIVSIKTGTLSRLYARFLAGLSQTSSVLRLTKFSVLVSLATALVISLPAQSLEALRAIAEAAIADGKDRSYIPLLFVAAGAVFLSLMSWYWARVLLYLNQPRVPTTRGVRAWSVRNLPRICGVIPLIGLSAAFYRASDRGITEPGRTQFLLLLLSAFTAVAAVLQYGFF